jgi:MoxR-like ATPase
MSSPSPEQFSQAAKVAAAIRSEVARALVGQKEAVDAVLVALLAGGHVLIEGVPGLGKTLLVRALARTFGGSFGRVQFTPDLMPADVTGHTLYDPKNQVFSARRGPVFVNLLLADEINRAPAKTQAALLEVMQEGQVTIEGQAHPLEPPFMVLATQNPIEQEGTYALPEAQLDRFLVKLDVGYPSADEELGMLGLTRRGVGAGDLDAVQAVAGADALRQARAEVDATRVEEDVARYVIDVVRRTRELPSVELGASPRAAVHLLGAARAAARLAGREFVTPDDVARMATPVLRHRLVLTPEAELERYRPDDAVRTALGDVPVPR